MNLKELASKLQGSDSFGDFTKRLISGEMWSGPRNGDLDDKAHPPIHPVKLAN